MPEYPLQRKLAQRFKVVSLRPGSFFLLHRQYVLLTLIALAVLSTAVSAHFVLNLNIRIVHAEHRLDESKPGLDVYLRLPMAYAVADLLGPPQADGSRAPAPYTHNAEIDGQLQHTLDVDALSRDPLGLGQIVLEGHHWTSGDEIVAARVIAVRVYTAELQTPFRTLGDAKRSFDEDQQIFDPVPFIGDCVVDVQLEIDSSQALTSYQFSSSLKPDLDGQEDTANLVLDYFADDVLIFRETGLLDVPLQISRTVWSAMKTFTVEGLEHILAGLDHVLFVVCLVIGALSPVALAWRVTGFTLGHSVTLTLGFFGFVPAWGWFVPAVELLIALSIVGAAFYSLFRPFSEARSASGPDAMFAITVITGLLHGFGFSFVLQEILKVSSPNLWQSLLAFNMGVEAGQLLIVALLWPLLMLAGRFSAVARRGMVWTLGAACLFVGSMWTSERLVILLGEI